MGLGAIIWTIVIGFIAGIVAKLIMPGKNEPSGFILTTILGVVGAFVATFLGQALGWYRAGEGAGLIGATVGAVIVPAANPREFCHEHLRKHNERNLWLKIGGRVARSAGRLVR